MKIFMIIEPDHVCHVLGACESEGLNCVADVGGWTLSKRTSGLDLDEDDCDRCKNCVLTIIMINMAIMMYKIIVKRGSKSKFAKA